MAATTRIGAPTPTTNIAMWCQSIRPLWAQIELEAIIPLDLSTQPVAASGLQYRHQDSREQAVDACRMHDQQHPQMSVKESTHGTISSRRSMLLSPFELSY